MLWFGNQIGVCVCVCDSRCVYVRVVVGRRIPGQYKRFAIVPLSFGSGFIVWAMFYVSVAHRRLPDM